MLCKDYYKFLISYVEEREWKYNIFGIEGKVRVWDKGILIVLINEVLGGSGWKRGW